MKNSKTKRTLTERFKIRMREFRDLRREDRASSTSSVLRFWCGIMVGVALCSLVFILSDTIAMHRDQTFLVDLSDSLSAEQQDGLRSGELTLVVDTVDKESADAARAALEQASSQDDGITDQSDTTQGTSSTPSEPAADSTVADSSAANSNAAGTGTTDPTVPQSTNTSKGAASLLQRLEQEKPLPSLDGTEVTPRGRSTEALRTMYTAMNAAATETYAYARIDAVPASLPASARAITVHLGDVSATGYGETTLAEFTHSGMGYQFKVTLPYIEGVTEKVQELDYRMIGVMFYDPYLDESRFDICVFNPAEDPYLSISFYAGEYNRCAVRVDEPVCSLGAFSRTPLVNGQWLSDGSSDFNYGTYGGSAGGDRNYIFDAHHLWLVDGASEYNNVNSTLRNIDEYVEYWQANADLVAERQSHFNVSRSVFDLDGYASLRGVTRAITLTGRAYQRADGSVLRIDPQSDGSVRLSVDGGAIYWSSDPYLIRVSNLPAKITISGGIQVVQHELATILRFMDGGGFTYYGPLRAGDST